MSEVVCPGCGEPAEYRLPTRFDGMLRCRAEYRCGPHAGYVYVHKIPPEQAVDKAYPMEAKP